MFTKYPRTAPTFDTFVKKPLTKDLRELILKISITDLAKRFKDEFSKLNLMDKNALENMIARIKNLQELLKTNENASVMDIEAMLVNKEKELDKS